MIIYYINTSDNTSYIYISFTIINFRNSKYYIKVIKIYVSGGSHETPLYDFYYDKEKIIK